MAAEAKNMRQKRPTAVKKMAAPFISAIAGESNSITVLGGDELEKSQIQYIK